MIYILFDYVQYAITNPVWAVCSAVLLGFSLAAIIKIAHEFFR